MEASEDVIKDMDLLPAVYVACIKKKDSMLMPSRIKSSCMVLLPHGRAMILDLDDLIVVDAGRFLLCHCAHCASADLDHLKCLEWRRHT